jgi:hypothetical protein
MAEVTCSTCGGDGLSQTPHPTYDASGNPTIEILIGTCTTCHGLGKVEQ